MSDNFKDVNLELLMGLKQHLEQAAKLQILLERLLSLAAQHAEQSNSELARRKGERRGTPASNRETVHAK